MDNKLIVKEVDFNGAQLMAVQDATTGKIHVGVSWICRGIGFTEKQKDRQVANLQEDIVLKLGCKKLPLKFEGQVRECLCIELDYLPLWLAKISITPNMQKEQPEVTKNLVEYQLKAKDVLAAAFIKQQFQIPKTLSEALRLAADQAETIEALELESAQKDKKIEEQKPKVEFYDTVTESKDTIDMGSAAKVLNMGIGRNDLFKFLREQGVLMGNNQPYQKYIDSMYFKTVETPYSTPDGTVHISIKTGVMQKGLDYIRRLYGKLSKSNAIIAD